MTEPTPLLLSKNSLDLHQSQERPLGKVGYTMSTLVNPMATPLAIVASFYCFWSKLQSGLLIFCFVFVFECDLLAVACSIFDNS